MMVFLRRSWKDLAQMKVTGCSNREVRVVGLVRHKEERLLSISQCLTALVI